VDAEATVNRHLAGGPRTSLGHNRWEAKDINAPEEGIISPRKRPRLREPPRTPARRKTTRSQSPWRHFRTYRRLELKEGTDHSRISAGRYAFGLSPLKGHLPLFVPDVSDNDCYVVVSSCAERSLDARLGDRLDVAIAIRGE